MADVVINLGHTLEQAERAVIVERLAMTPNKKACAVSLGISRSALYAKLDRLKIPHERKLGTTEMRHAPAPDDRSRFDARPAFGGESA